MRDQLHGCIRIKVKGRELYSFINRLHSGRIRCTRQYCRNDVFHGQVRRRDMPEIRRIARELGMTVSALECETLSAKLIRRRRRFGIAAGAAAVLAACVYFSGAVITIEVQGNERISDSVILSALADTGIRRGTRLSSIDYITAENMLMMNVEGLAWAGMHRSGSRIVVEVTEMTEQPEMVLDRMPCNIFSTHDARIVDVLVRDGMLMRCIGSEVKKGDLLVSGIITGETGRTSLRHSMADIIGEYSEDVCFSGSFDVSDTVFTGKTKHIRSLRLFDLVIPLFSGRNEFADFAVRTAEHPLYVFGRQLPVSIIDRSLSERTVTVQHLSQEQLCQQLIGKMYLYEQNFLKDAIVIGRQIDAVSDDQHMELRVNYCLRGSICESREIMMKQP